MYTSGLLAAILNLPSEAISNGVRHNSTDKVIVENVRITFGMLSLSRLGVAIHVLRFAGHHLKITGQVMLDVLDGSQPTWGKVASGRFYPAW